MGHVGQMLFFLLIVALIFIATQKRKWTLEKDPNAKKENLVVNKNVPTSIREGFLSHANMMRIQNKLKHKVFELSSGKFVLQGEQRTTDLYAVMHGVYEQSNFVDNVGVVKRIKQLNDVVINTIIPGMMANLKAYYHYMNKIQNPREVITIPESANIAGSRTPPPHKF